MGSKQWAVVAEPGPQTQAGLRAVEAAGGDIQRELFPGVRVELFVGQQVVFGEEHQTGGQGGAFVPVHKRVVAAEVEPVGGGDGGLE